jgi:PAS domain S-box-containing protein
MSEHTNGGRAHAYQMLRESEELHRATLSSISDAVFMTDDEGQFTYICPNVDVIFGYAPDEVQALTKIHGLLGPNLFDRAELVARGEICNIVRDVRSKSGERRSLLIHVKAVSILNGTQLYCCRDVTEYRRAEEELQAARLDLTHASRLALIGELLASIAHEVNQPLTSIVTNATAGIGLLGRGGAAAREPELRAILADINELGHRAAGVIHRIQTLSRKRPIERQQVDVNELVADTLRLVETDARRRGIELRPELAPAPPIVAADRIWLQQVLLNLALNGMDAMDEAEPEQRVLAVRAHALPEVVEITVTDNGHGIPPDRLPQLFNAFFTTKRDGIGLGLAIARSIVEAHGGKVSAEDRGGRGATFRVTLPIGQVSATG